MIFDISFSHYLSYCVFNQMWNKMSCIIIYILCICEILILCYYIGYRYRMHHKFIYFYQFLFLYVTYLMKKIIIKLNLWF